jgi:choline dehydrogenase-like flavoprotein
VPGLRDPIVTFRLARPDWRLLVSGVARLTQLLLAAGAHTVIPSARGAGAISSARDVPRVHEALRPAATSLMTVHLMSTVPLGEDPARCAVDSFGALRAIGGVHVNDASLLPGAPGVNPQGTVMAIARRNVLRHLGAA